VTLDVDVQYAPDLDGYMLPEENEIYQWVSAALKDRDVQTQLTVRIVGEAEMVMLNESYRYKAGSTNVLSFPFEAVGDVTLPLLGDVIICAPVVKREANEQNKMIKAHWCHLVVHGVLHLLGFDHMEDSEAQRMELREGKILTALGFSDPYEESVLSM